MINIDKIDEQIMMLLQEDASQSSDIVAKKIGISSPTVRRRLKNLIDSGVIHIQALVDPKKVGLNLAAVIACDVDPDKLKSAVETLANRPEITWISSCTGRFDLIMNTRFHSTEELASFIQQQLPHLKGLRNTETFVCLEVMTKYTRHIVRQVGVNSSTSQTDEA